MREGLRAHAHAVTAFLVFGVVALLLGTSIDAGGGVQASVGLPTEPIALPGAGEDADGDSYHDDVDLHDGDLLVRVDLVELDSPGIAPHFLLGTQHDQWRLGDGASLRWPHVVDHDPLGRKPGSTSWFQDVVRTGAWWYSPPGEGLKRAMHGDGRLSGEVEGAPWPLTFYANVREDREWVELKLELYDVRPDPDVLVHAWDLSINVLDGRTSIAGAERSEGVLATAGPLTLSLERTTAPNMTTRQAMADRWAPHVFFDSMERFYPTTGDAMERFHGFSRRAPEDRDYRTWTRDFNNGRDGYVLLLADFTGDGIVDSADAAAMIDILRSGGVASDTLYSHVQLTTQGKLVIQYWLIYMYNFQRDEQGTEIEVLAHKGDREFIQLVFDDPEDVWSGMPSAVAYSQHYGGLLVKDPVAGLPPFHLNDTHLAIYPARGSHASYPYPGDDDRFRPAFAGYQDIFDGQGEHWSPETYTLEIMASQEWFQGHLWGPITRHHRDLGTSTKPLLQHSFRYAFIDPVPWMDLLRELPQDGLADAYGGTV